MNLIEYKQRLNKYCEYPEYLFKLTDKCIHEFPSKSSNECIHYGVLIWFLSKFVQDKILNVKSYSRISGIKYYDLLLYEDHLFTYYLKYTNHLNRIIFKNHLNPLIGCGTPLPPLPELPIKELRGVGDPETLRNGPPGLENPGCDACSDSMLSTCA